MKTESGLFVPRESYEEYLKRMGDDEGARDLHFKNEVVESLEPLAEISLKYLGKREKQWFPDQYLDDAEKLRENAKNLSPRTIGIFLGNAVTEKGLPAYMTALNKAASMSDYTGKDDTARAQWTRGWTAQELEHEEVSYGWALLSGRVNMRLLNILNYNLLRNGFDPRTRDDPYKGFAYTTPQELATWLSWKNTGELAKKDGDNLVHEISTIRIAPDEWRHYEFNRDFFKGIVEADPDGAIITVDNIMTRDGGMVMPGATMSELVGEVGTEVKKTPYFEMFEIAAQKAEVYTIYDYVKIFKTLIKDWSLDDLKTPLRTDKGKEAQSHLLRVAGILEKRADTEYEKIQAKPDPDFSFLLK